MTSIVRNVQGWHRPLVWLTGLMAVTAVVSAGGYVVDTRTLLGVPIWAKPFKFSVSFAVYAVTLAWLVSRLRRPRVRTVARRTCTVIAVASAVEMAAIVGQVIRGRRSHFNFSTPLDSFVFAVMGAMVVIIFVATIAVGVAFLRESPVTDRATATAVRLGLGVGLAGMSVGFLMLRPTPGQGPGSPIHGGHSVGVDDGGASLPLLGWDTTGGDLRIAHFIGMHALQAVPLLALALFLLPATARLTEHARVRLVVIGAAGWAGLFGVTLWQALRGQPITAPDAWTVTAAVLLVVLVAGAAAAVWYGDGRAHRLLQPTSQRTR